MKMGLVPICLLTLAALLAGCVSYDRSQGVANTWRDPSVPAPVKGRTTQSDIIEVLGPPSQLIALKDQTVFYYLKEHRKGKGAVFLVYNWIEEDVTYDRAIFSSTRMECCRTMDTATKKLSRRHSFLLVLVMLTGTGCTVIGKKTGEPIAVEQAGQKEGVTNVAGVVESFGPPAHMSAMPDGLVMVYEHIDAGERQFGIDTGLIGLDWFKMSFGRAQAKYEVLLLLFDGDGTLQAQGFRNWTDDLGKGLGFQLFFVAAPTVDTRHLNEKPEQLMWGSAALEPLPVTLNAAQSLVRGSHGIEMRGTPNSIGQRTLEMRTPGRRKGRQQ